MLSITSDVLVNRSKKNFVMASSLVVFWATAVR